MKKKKETLCWTCQNACCGCSWSKSFTPVEGWDAVPTKLKYAIDDGEQTYTDSFYVKKCPEYIPDEKRGGAE